MKLPAVVVAIMLISLDTVLCAAEEETDSRAAPWWHALRAKTYSEQCHSSCTESSQGTKITVELCNDTEVLVSHREKSCVILGHILWDRLGRPG